jgi:hypothetical protein
MDRSLWKPDDEHSKWIVREIWNRSGVVRRGEDVDCKRSGAKQTRIIASCISEWNGMAGCKDRITDNSGDSGRSKRRGVGVSNNNELGDSSNRNE